MSIIIDLLPMPAEKGPPLPRMLDVTWPGGYELIASGSKYDIVTRLPKYEDQFEEGDKGYVDVQLIYAPAAELVSSLDSYLGDRLPEHKLEVRGSHVEIHFKKSIEPLTIIIIAVSAFILGLIVAWSLYRESPEEAPLILIGIIAAAIGAGALALSKFTPGLLKIPKR